MSNTLEVIIECLPVADVPELILHYLIGDVALNSLSSDVFDQVFNVKYVESRLFRSILITFSCLDPEKRILHSFADQPCWSKQQKLFAKKSASWWYKNGHPHRDGDKPAVVSYNGGKGWWVNGKRHRDNDAPAQIFKNGTQVWWKNGVKHRDGDNPAVITASGDREWWQDGKKHRDNGLPAVESKDGTKQWFINGIEVNWFKRIILKFKQWKNNK